MTSADQPATSPPTGTGPRRLVFDGTITGLGTSSGIRLVVGDWPRSPFGPFTDVMIEEASGVRTLLAPTDEIAAFVSAVYTFDCVMVTPVRVDRTPHGRDLRAGPLRLRVLLGRRTPLGYVLRAVPAPLARSPRWISMLDPLVRLVQHGVRTTGSAGNGRREWYGALDVRRVVSAGGTWDDVPLGDLRPVDPPVRFGFGSTPPAPAMVRIVTTVDVPAGP